MAQVSDDVICINGYQIYRTDRVGKEGVVAVYVNSKVRSSATLCITKPKQFELLAIKLSVSNYSHITVVGCYRPLSASKDALTSLRCFT